MTTELESIDALRNPAPPSPTRSAPPSCPSAATTAVRASSSAPAAS